ncbi:MAG TPA: ethanolamine ammonia-lyase subunit EutC [Methylophilaceae bacterium]|nr:ethanolamine ammonia-lyase subunit EutC [Methylophilaceae bacterium]
MSTDKPISPRDAPDTSIQDPWQQLRQFTRARIALGRVGSSLPTKEVLDFGLAHAMARDAVHLALDVNALEQSINDIGSKTIRVHSRAPDRANYLLRPDWGRRLDEASLDLLKVSKPQTPIDFLVVVGDGLSSLAVERHVVPLLNEIQACMPSTWVVGPVVIASQARVAIADEIGETLGARMTAMLIGERPGLSSPDSLGIYLTYAPKVGYSDADRNCISNVRPEGLNYPAAAKKMMWLAKEAMRLQVSGVALKDESDAVQIDVEASPSLPDKS